MRNYDATILLSPSLREEEAHDRLRQIASLVQEREGIVMKSELRGKKPLEAPIGGEEEALLAHMAFSAQPDAADEASREMKHQPSVLRSIVMRASSAKTAAPTFSPALRQRKPEEAHASVEDIDKQLEEIFTPGPEEPSS